MRTRSARSYIWNIIFKTCVYKFMNHAYTAAGISVAHTRTYFIIIIVWARARSVCHRHHQRARALRSRAITFDVFINKSTQHILIIYTLKCLRRRRWCLLYKFYIYLCAYRKLSSEYLCAIYSHFEINELQMESENARKMKIRIKSSSSHICLSIQNIFYVFTRHQTVCIYRNIYIYV